MVPLDAGIASLGNWKQLGFVAPDAKAMMDRLSAVGFGPFKVYRVDSGDWEGVTYRGAPAERYALEVCMATGTWDVEIIVPIPGGGRTIYGEYLAQQPGRRPPPHRRVPGRRPVRRRLPVPGGPRVCADPGRADPGHRPQRPLRLLRGRCAARAHPGAPGHAGGLRHAGLRVSIAGHPGTRSVSLSSCPRSERSPDEASRAATAPPYTGVTLTADGAWVEAFAVGDR